MPVFAVVTYAEVEKEFPSLAHKPDINVFLLALLIETHQ
jgi:hypothetical protein